MNSNDICSSTHIRYNPLKKEWILVCPDRLSRPWHGQVEEDEPSDSSSSNYLAPGAVRSSGAINPLYDGVFVFDNDFPALRYDHSDNIMVKNSSELFRMKNSEGICRVMCFHPDKTKTIANMNESEVVAIINEWIKQVFELLGFERIRYVQIFENKGYINGCSNSHPHCQIWGSSFVPTELKTENKSFRKYFSKHGRGLLLDYVELEESKGERVVMKTEHFLLLVPYWAVWPFETLLIPRGRHIPDITCLNEDEIVDLGKVLKKLCQVYNKVFDCEFPYSMGWHQAPKGKLGSCASNLEPWQLHAHYYPPLVRSKHIKKFMVGYEMLAQPQRDFSPELAAKRLRDLL